MKLRTLIFPLVILLLAFGLRLWTLTTESIWHDEGWSIRAITGLQPDDNTPPAYYAAASVLWRAGAGSSPLAFRYPSVLLGLLGTALALTLARRWIGGGAGLLAAGLVAVNPLLWEYAQEVRAYVAVPLIALILLHGADRLLRETPPRPRDWALVFGAALAGLYTHNLAVPLVAWLNAALGIGWLVGRRWRRMAVWAALQTVLIVLYLPWVFTQSPSGTPLNTPPQLGLGLVRDMWYSAFLPVLPQLQANRAAPLLAILGGLGTLAAVIALAAAPGKRRVLGLLLSHAVLVPAFSTALLLAAHIDFHPRYTIAAVPGLLLLGMMSVRLAAQTLTPPKAARLAAVAAAAWGGLLGAASLHSLHQLTTTRTYQHDDFAGVAAEIAVLPPGAVVLLPFPTEPALQVYYASQMPLHARFVNLPLYADEATALRTIQRLRAEGVSQVLFVTWFQLPADVRGMIPCLLAASSTHLDAPRTTFGLMTQTFSLAAPGTTPADWHALDAAPRYADFDLLRAGYLAAPAGVCVRTEWALRRPATAPVSAAVSLTNPLGAEIARGDASIARPDQVTAPGWSVGEAGQAYARLHLPEGAPPGRYGVGLTLYSTAQPSGIDLLDSAGAPAGKTLWLDAGVLAAGPPVAAAPTQPTLVTASAASGTLLTGLPLDVTLLLPGRADRMPYRAELGGAGWSLARDIIPQPEAALAWERFVVPPGHAGEAVLRVDGLTLARYTLTDPPRRFSPPSVEIPLGDEFPGTAMLAGATVPPSPLSAAEPFSVTLVWQAAATPSTEYTVFVQLLADDGRVLAQSDAQPGAGERPTSSWVEGEYIADTHTLRWNITDYAGTARLIAGLYDAAQGFRRVPTRSGQDHALVALRSVAR